ncbi:MAG TPA: SGNH/GDSL hydrolase family protein [Pirellulaceae bacterium]|nr:SGNH/GDSL hydrolase family protein [Pirellulaceae bacterium]
MKNPLRVALSSVALIGCIAAQTVSAEPLDPAKVKPSDDGKILYYDALQLGLEGQGFADVKAPYDRLPAKAEGKVRPEVWSLSRNSAGLSVRFVTDAQAIHARWTLTSDRLDMPHMPSTGVSGLDLYVKMPDSKLRWLANKSPTAKTTSIALVTGIPAGKREYMLYLPLYNGTESLEIGIPKESTLEKAPPRDAGRSKPVVFYGTSITQGGCASRPGMVHTAILGRWLDRPVINLGFSGNGRMEREVAESMAEIDAAALVIDCLPNLAADQVTERTAPLVKILREKRPETPIVLVEDRNYTDGFLLPGKRERNETNQAALKKAFQELKAAGDKHLYYIEGAGMIGDDSEGTVDSSHPTDLGFYRQAEAFMKVLGPILP